MRDYEGGDVLLDLEILQRPHPQMAGFATNEAAAKDKNSKEALSKEKASKEAASKEQASKEATSNRKPPTPGEGGGGDYIGGIGPPQEDSLHGQYDSFLAFLLSHPWGVLIMGGFTNPRSGLIALLGRLAERINFISSTNRSA